MTAPTDRDRQTAATVLRMWATDDVRAEAIAVALAEERERVLGPVRALADQLDHEGVVQLFHGPSNRNAHTTARIRNAIEETR